MLKTVIALDLDDVITDTETALARECRKRFPKKISDEDIKNKSVENLGEKYKRYIYDELLDDPGFLIDLPLLPQVREALELGRIRGYQMHIVTGRFLSPSALFGTLTWIKENKLESCFEHVFLRPRGTRSPEFKANLVKKLGALCLVDDRPDTCIAAARVTDAAFILDQPWNRSGDWIKKIFQYPNIKRVKTLYQAIKMIPDV